MWGGEDCQNDGYFRIRQGGAEGEGGKGTRGGLRGGQSDGGRAEGGEE